MASNSNALDDRLFLAALQPPDSGNLPLRQQLAEMERMFSAAQEEIALLSGERDELVAAIKKWAKADRLERQELLLETATQELRTEMKQLRNTVKRLKRENALLQATTNGDQEHRLRA